MNSGSLQESGWGVVNTPKLENKKRKMQTKNNKEF